MDIEALISQHKDAVYRQMVRVCGSYDDAEDALGDALLAAVKAADQLKDEAAFRGWLTRIGSRACARSRIRARVSREVSLAALEELGFEVAALQPDPAEEVFQNDTHRCVKKAMEALPEIYREVYLRREVGGEPAEEVASALGLTVAAVKSRLHRARALVREALDGEFGCSDPS